MTDNKHTWRCALPVAAGWLAVTGLAHGLFRYLCLPTNLGMQEFFLWGTFVLASFLAVAIIAGGVHRSWKVACIVLLAGIVLGYLAVEIFQ